MKEILYFICAFVLISFINVAHADIIIYTVEEHVTYNVLKDMPSTFGEAIPFQGFEGSLVVAQPVDACDSISPPPPMHNSAKNWVALIARHNCSYERKVRVAQDAKYNAVIVHNVDSDNLIAMTATNTTGIRIPSVFIGQFDATYLKELLSRPDLRFYIIITPDAPFNINTHLLLPFAIVVAILFLVMIIFMIVKCIKDRRRARRHRLPTSALNKMLLHKFVKGDPYETCVICLDDYVEGEKLRVLPCAHAYHSKCIDPWLTNNRRVCPICKRKVFAQNEEPCSSDSDTDDDTTPLINASNQNQAAGGGTFGGVTFGVSNEIVPSPELARQEFARLLGYIRDHQLVLGSDYPSINGESSAEASQSGSPTSGSGVEHETDPPASRHCPDTSEVHVHTRPEPRKGSSGSDVVI